MKSRRLLLILLLLAVVLGVVVYMLLPQGALDLHLAPPAQDAQESPAEPAGPTLSDCALIHEPEFGGVYIQTTIDDFNALGFQYGDSVDVTFSNGYTLKDLPCYNGYYTANGEPLLVAYPGYPYIKAAINNGDDLWTVAGLSEGDTATITLNTQGKYLDIQNARDIQYTDNRDDYESDAVFANFRAVQAGEIQPDRLFRSASPCDNQHNRAPYVDKLLGEAGVQWILNLANDAENIEYYFDEPDFASPNFAVLYEAGKVDAIALNMNYSSAVFREKLAAGLANMSAQTGPYLVHCTEGKDRTGFVCMLLEALCGASYQEIVDDYMLTYANYYGITETSDPNRYSVIVANVLDPMIRSMAGDGVDITTADLSACAVQFLQNAGMTDEQITALRDRLTQP